MLFFAGIAMAATNLMFAWIAVTGPDLTLFVVAVVVDGITSSVCYCGICCIHYLLRKPPSRGRPVRSIGISWKRRQDGIGSF